MIIHTGQPLGLYSSDPQEFAEADLGSLEAGQKMLRGEIPAQDMGPIAIQAIISHITFSREGFIIARMNRVKLSWEHDESCHWSGVPSNRQWVDDPRFGRQFKFTRYVAEIPQSTDGIYRYLVKVAKWVGPRWDGALLTPLGKKPWKF